MTDESKATAARRSWAAQREAMVEGDAESLGEELAPGFTLTHMTGYVQARHEWLREVASGSMAYHAIHDVEVSVDTSAEDEGPVLTVRTRTDATIWGSRATWPLQLEIHFADSDGRWIASRTVASTW